MAGPATNASSNAIIKNILGKRTLYHYVALISFTAILFGIILDTFFTISLPKISSHGHHHGMEGWGPTIIALTFLLVLVNAYIAKFRPEKQASSELENEMKNQQEQIAITVDGMTCSHCKESVESAIYSFNGVVNASVDLLTGKVLVSGAGIDEEALKDKITAKGFSIK